jgi:uncharacterized protein (TIGR02996 family)
MSSLREALEQAILADPDDRAAHMAHADFLAEQGDPRGELIQVQLALEDPALPAGERKKLQAREKKLLRAHRRDWLGPLLAPPLLEGLRLSDYAFTRPEEIRFEFRRGWLDRLEVPALNGALARALRQAPEARLLSDLQMGNAADDEFDGEDIPQSAVLALLSGAPFLARLRRLRLGAPCSDEIDPTSLGDGAVYEDSAYTFAWGADTVVDLLAETARLEELRLFCQIEEKGDRLWDVPALGGLRVFQAYHLHDYDLGKLAKQPGPPRLEQLLLMPHAVWPGGSSYLPRDEVIAFLYSGKASKLTRLQLRMSDLGDEGVAAIIDTGLARRLEMLDLRHGEVTDAGARDLAAAVPGGKLRRLDLQRNRLTGAGVAALAALGLPELRVEHQQVPDQAGEYDDQYLYDGDWE